MAKGRRKGMAPPDSGSASVDTADGGGLSEAFAKISDLLQQAVVHLNLQNEREADTVARTAEALYEASKQKASPTELPLLKSLSKLVCLYAPLTRALVFQTEGQFEYACGELERGLATCNEGIAALEEYAQMPDADAEPLLSLKPVYSIFPVLFRGYNAAVRAEIFGYQGNITRYVQLLREAVKELRRAERLPPSMDTTFLALVGFCANHAGRLERRIREFSAKQKEGLQRIYPSGDSIFIVHGHDEAKWRELRDLVEDQLGLKTIVLKEEAGASAVLIRKFEDEADRCCFAFALLTPDDFVEKEGESYFQARPNVLFELGWFYGRFGPERVCVVKKAGTELPSDLAGISTVDFQKDVSEAMVKIQAELRRLGIMGGDPGGSGRRSTGATGKGRPVGRR
ncbi:MAG: nucleotide-binding protein [Deltaproteobacteria bacterium]|nr:nucleotide-binding protein [Deltaproteobacteria bacterium]